MRHCIACLSTVASVHCSRSVCRGAHLAPDCGGIGGTCRKKTLSRMVSAYYAPPKVTSNKYKLFYTEFPPLVFWIAAGILHFQRSPWIILVLHHSYFWQISVRPWLVVLNIVLLLYFWLHHIFGWMKCHHWLSVSYKLISAIDGDAITNMEWYPSLTARQTVNVFVLTHIALPSPDDTKQKIMYSLTLHEELWASTSGIALRASSTAIPLVEAHPFRGQSLYMKKIAKA